MLLDQVISFTCLLSYLLPAEHVVHTYIHTRSTWVMVHGLWYMPRAASSSVARHAWILLGGERGGAAREPRHREARHREGARKLAHS